MIDIAQYRLEALRQGQEFDLFRGYSANGVSVLLMAPSTDPQNASNLARLERELALKEELKREWALQPLDMADYHGRRMLMLEDFEGTPLDQLLGRPLGLSAFLQLAAQMTAALGRVHASGLTHQDVRPANVIVDADARVRLTGFGVAARLPYEPQAGEALTIAAFAYLAPEQTGRVNRPVDARSDLYSLGVTFYEMLTGSPPFRTKELAESIHLHIAARPQPLNERLARADAVPRPLEAIVLRLLAKDPEDRYQTAAGLEQDLRACLASWSSHRWIEPFELGSRDVPGRLMLSNKLYGRQAEFQALAESFEAVVTEGRTQLVLISGYSGVGKSSMVTELQKLIGPAGGLFAAGKFDQYKRDIPYSSLAEAFGNLVNQLLAKSDDELAQWRASLLDALGTNGQLMINLIPKLSLIIGDQPIVAELASPEAQNRFNTAFGRLIDVFARPEHPLTLFLDDLQWLDAATIALLERLAIEQNPRHLLLVAAYRDNEVDSTHPLPRALSSIRAAGRSVREIVLAPLDLTNITELVADVLHTDQSQALSLAQLLLAKTGGNPFFVRQFISTLVEEKLVIYDSSLGEWSWDIDRIRAKGITENVAQLMATKVSRLSRQTREAISQLACLGNVADSVVLSSVYGGSLADLKAAISPAVQQGLVLSHAGTYAFPHDRIQEAAYGLIAGPDRPAVHRRIGRVLLAETPSAKLDERIFEVVNQFDRGAPLIDTLEERLEVCELHLRAGIRAIKSLAHAVAVKYLLAGRELLPSDCWEQHYRLTFEMEFNIATCEAFASDVTSHANADARLVHLLESANNLPDIARVASARVSFYSALGESVRAVKIGLDYLRGVGIDWIKNPSDEAVDGELQALQTSRYGRSMEQLLDLPLMADPDWLATMSVLAEILAPATFVSEGLGNLVLIRMARISLEHGNCEASAIAYTFMFTTIRVRLGDLTSALAFAGVGRTLVERFGWERYGARAYTTFGCRVIPWTEPLRSSRHVLDRAIRATNANGDLAYSAYGMQNQIANLLAGGEDLVSLQREAEDFRLVSRKTQIDLVCDCLTGNIMLMRELRDLPPESSYPSRSSFERYLEDGGSRLMIAAAWYWVHALQSAIFFGDLPRATHAAAKAETLLPLCEYPVEAVDYRFYGGIFAARTYDQTGSKQALATLIAHFETLSDWAKHCPANFAARAALLGAELARIRGNVGDAVGYYEDSVRYARENDNPNDEALASEVAAHFHARVGHQTTASAYLLRARRCYERWGAVAKVRQLEQKFPELNSGTVLGVQPPSTRRFEQLDVEVILRAAQAISGEIHLQKLIDTLMRIAIEHAGAQRGLLILLRNGQYKIVAEAIIADDGVQVTFEEKRISGKHLSLAALAYVQRTRESLLLDDASQSPVLSEDKYVQARASRSLACIPIVKHADLGGVLYLENDLSSNVFTVERTSILEMLSSQAAISLENAYLYADLARSEGFLADAQRMSSTGSWSWNIATDQVLLSDEHSRILGKQPDRDPLPSTVLLEEVTHPDDRTLLQQQALNAIREHAPMAVDYRIVLADGTVKHLHSVGRPILDASGQVSDYVGSTMDVTMRKQAEDALREAQAEVQQIARSTTIGELAASIAHEVNQPLATIITNAATCIRWLDADRPNVVRARMAAEKVLEDGWLAAKIVENIRGMLSKSSPELRPIRLNVVIGEVLDLMREELQRNAITVETAFNDAAVAVVGDQIQVQQVILNLVANAIDALRAVEGRARQLCIRTKRMDDDFIETTVEDTGAGIEAANIGRIFEPFFTTKKRGMGMGLSICRSFVEAHGGTLAAKRLESHGTAISFTLPIEAALTDVMHALPALK
jgi:predicted ATPase/signal transduction histidine kinase